MITDKKILPKLELIENRYLPYCFERLGEVAVEVAETREHYRREPTDEAGLNWTPFKIGKKWGADGLTGWMRGEAHLPEACAGRKVLVEAMTGGAETLFFVDGKPRGVFDANHKAVMLTMRGVSGERFHLAFESYCGHAHPGCMPDEKAKPVERNALRFEGIHLVGEREDVIGFIFDLRVLRQLAETLDADSLRRGAIVAGLAEVYKAIDAIPEETGEENWRPKLQKARALMRPLLDARNGSTAPKMGIVGHSHLDTAWLWTIAETKRKCARTFSSALNLMDQYPEFRFLQSAPYHTEIVRSEYPDIYEAIRHRVRQGRWEPNGAMYIEPDCNIPSGESFVRQLLVGQTLTRQMFGYTSDTMWEPDVFGYSGALPQILRGCGVEFFCTTKLSWNDMTRFPYDTFVWKGIDGSSVVAHFNTIHCWPDPKTLLENWKMVQHKDAQDRRLLSYGYGDGGGGPQYEMIEVARRVVDLEGCPRAEHVSVGKFMQGIRDEIPNLPEWRGELYLELHRGTLTSIAAIKRLNRKTEFALRDAELLWTLAALRGETYPAERLLALWKILLVNQFHDILPGSSIAAVNDEAIAELGACRSDARALGAEAFENLAKGEKTDRHHLMLLNSLSWDRKGELVLDDVPERLVPNGGTSVWQRIQDLDGKRKLLLSGPRVPALGSVIVELEEAAAHQCDLLRSPFKVRERSIETPFARVRFDAAGRIVSFVDRASGRQLARKGGALNAFWIGEDVPRAWDNWDIDYDQAGKMEPTARLATREAEADGPLQLRMRSVYQVGDRSTLVQDMIFHATSPRVDFETVVDWEEKHKLLKVGFDLDILTDFARHEIQYGYVERTTHENQLDDRAQFEVCAHKWSDLSETGFGVALLNDCKYAVEVKGGDLRLTLIKSGTHPDPRGDAGRHRFTYALLPHSGGFSVESVVRPAYELNVPLLSTAAGPGATPCALPLAVDAPSVIVESVKWAEDGEGFIVRLYEASRTGSFARIEFGSEVKGVSETNMLEEEPQELELKKSAVDLYFRPFEIKTLYCEV